MNPVGSPNATKLASSNPGGPRTRSSGPERASRDATGAPSGRNDAIAAIAVLSVVALLILPVPPLLLDLLLAVSICIGVTILMTALYMERPVEFSTFPTVLLVVTLFRLTLNVASTRLILLDGHEGPDKVGAIILAFGKFVAGGDLIVGLVIFVILVLINFVVITKGSGRIAEVAARFTLDALPGKQMSIDADLNAGVIGEQEAKERRASVEREADFYGAMDGASKFVRGDAIAGLIVTGINLIGGVLIGMFKHGVSVTRALDTYAILTIGDGLVSQLPALVISTAAGVIVTRAAGAGRLAGEVESQIFSNPKPLYLTGGLVGVLGLVPGLPGLPLFALAGAAIYLARQASQRADANRTEAAVEPTPTPEEKPIEDLLRVETLELEVGYSLVDLVDANKGGALMGRITGIRRQLAKSLGIILPPVKVRDNLQLSPNEYVLYLRTVPIAKGSVEIGRYLAIDPGTATQVLDGVATKEPAFGLDAIWIDEAQRDDAEAAGYTTVDSATVIATHVSEELRRHAHDLLGRQEVQELLAALGKTHQKLVDDLVPKQVPPKDLLQVLRTLLEEQVPIRDLRTILETLADLLPETKGAEALADAVRQRLSSALTHRLSEASGELHAHFLAPNLETAFRKAFQHGSAEGSGLDGEALRTILSNFENAASEAASAGHSPVVIVAPDLRRQIRNLICRFIPNIAVLSHREVDGHIEVRSLGRIGI